MRFRLRTSGYALITTLIMLMLLFMMVLTLILSTRHSSFLTRGYHDRTAALYVAESGLARALEMLAEDPAWAPKDFTEPMPSGQGTRNE